MNAASVVFGIVAGVLIAVASWLLLSGSLGMAMSRRLCGEGILSVPCVLIGVVMAYLLPPILGVAGGWFAGSLLNRKLKK